MYVGKLIRGNDYFVKLKRIEFTIDGESSRLFQDISSFEKAITITSAQIISKDEL
jgi:hypothetical protein